MPPLPDNGIFISIYWTFADLLNSTLSHNEIMRLKRMGNEASILTGSMTGTTSSAGPRRNSQSTSQTSSSSGKLL